jgi:hypothetical protein
MISAGAVRVATLPPPCAARPPRPGAEGLLDEIGHAFVLFGNREQLRSDLGKSGSCGLVPKSYRGSLIAMRV